MKFIKLTSARGLEREGLYINIDSIVYINLYNEISFKGATVTRVGTIPFTVANSETFRQCFFVWETPEEILKLIEEAK